MPDRNSNASNGNGNPPRPGPNAPTHPRASTATITTINSSRDSMLSQRSTVSTGTLDNLYDGYLQRPNSDAASRDSSGSITIGMRDSTLAAARGAASGASGQSVRPPSRQRPQTPTSASRPSSLDRMSAALRQSPGSAAGGVQRASGVSNTSGGSSRSLEIGISNLDLGQASDSSRPSPPRTAEQKRQADEKAKAYEAMVQRSGRVSGKKRGKTYGETDD